MGNRVDPQLELVTKNWVSVQHSIAVFIRSVVRDQDASEDILQEVALTVLRKRDEYRADASFYSWARSIAHYEVLAWKRRQARSRLVFSEEVIERVAQRFPSSASSQLDSYLDALKHCVSRLKGRASLVVDRFYRDDKRVGEIADSLGVSSNVVSVTLSKARTALKHCITSRLKHAEGGKHV